MNNSLRIAYFVKYCLVNLLYRAETEICFLKEKGKFKIQINLDRRSLRLIPKI